MRCSSFGEVYRAVDRGVYQDAAIKKVRMITADEQCENENERLETSTYPSVITATIPLR